MSNSKIDYKEVYQKRKVKTTVSESAIFTCHYCGKEVATSKIFCDEHSTPMNLQIFEFFSDFPTNIDGEPIRPRGGKLYNLISYYLAAKFGVSDKRRIILKSMTGAGKSILLDMIAFIELTHFPNSLTIIGSVSEKVSQEHIINLRYWISNSVFRRYLEGTHEATASKTELHLAKLNSRVLSMPQSEKTRTGWHGSLVLIDEIGRMRSDAYYGSFFQMARREKAIEVLASTPFLDSIVMYNIWNDDNVTRIALEPNDCWWIPKSTFEDAKNMPEDLYEQLFQAKFRGISGNRVIPDDMLLQAQSRDSHLPQSKNLVMGIDFGQSIDWTAVLVLDIETGDVKFLDMFQDDWNIQADKIRNYYKQWKPIKIVADKSHVGSVMISNLQDLYIEGVSMHNDILKKQVIDRLIMAFLNQKVNIVTSEFPKLISELSSYVYLDSEHKKMGAAGRGHDDSVVALAMALKGMDVSSIDMSKQQANLWGFTRIGGGSGGSSNWGLTSV